MNFISIVQKSLNDFKKDFGKALLIMVLDSLFIMVSAFIFSSLFRSIWDKLMKLLAFVFSKKEPDAELQQFITDITSKQDVMNLIWAIIIKATIFFFILAAVWTLFQIITWHIANSIATKSKQIISIRKYGIRMFALNTLFAPIVFIILAITIHLSFGTKIQAALVAGGFSFIFSQKIILGIGALFLTLISIIIFVSYVIAFKIGFLKNIKKTIQIFKQRGICIFLSLVLTLIALFVSHRIQAMLSVFNITIMFIIGFIMDFSILVIFRLLVINAVISKTKQP